MNPRRHSSVRRLLAVFGVLTGTILVVSLLSAVVVDGLRATRACERELAEARRLVQIMIDERLACARLLAAQATGQAQPAAGASGPVTVLVIDADGRVRASSSERLLPRLHLLAGRLPPGLRSGIEIDDREVPSAVAAASTPSGIVVAALPFTPDDARAIKEATGLDCSFTSGRQWLITTLKPAPDQPAPGMPPAATTPGALVPADPALWLQRVAAALRAARPRQVAIPLLGLDGSPVGVCTLHYSGDPALLSGWRWPELAAAPLALGLLALLLAWLWRRLLRPLAAFEADLARLAEAPEAGALAAPYGLHELDALRPHVNRLHAARAALAHNNELLNGRLIQAQIPAVLGQLAAGVAHDLNNPLTTIMGLADIILDSNPDADTQHDVAIIRRQAERSGNIVRSLLGFARRQRTEPQWVALNELITQTLELLAYQARVSNVRCETQLADDLPPTWADPSQIQQVLFNLINNALQAAATGKGRGTVRVESTWSPPEPGLPAGQVTVRVRDDGPGIAPEVMPHLFEAFYTTRGASGGTGLGLCLALDVVRRHNGRLWAENNAHRGACFTMQLPVTSDPTRGPSFSGAPRAGPHHILLADGDARRLNLLAQMLRRQGCLLSTATDGLLARSKLELEPFDLVVCAVEMPRLDGRELHAWVCIHRPQLAGRFAFVIEGEITAEVECLLQATRAWVLLPPFREETLCTLIDQALR